MNVMTGSKEDRILSTGNFYLFFGGCCRHLTTSIRFLESLTKRGSIACLVLHLRFAYYCHPHLFSLSSNSGMEIRRLLSRLSMNLIDGPSSSCAMYLTLEMVTEMLEDLHF